MIPCREHFWNKVSHLLVADNPFPSVRDTGSLMKQAEL